MVFRGRICHSKRKRSKGPCLPKKSAADRHVRPQVSVADAGTQTEEEMQAEREQDAAVLKVFNITTSVTSENSDDEDCHSGLDDDFDDEDFF